MWHFKGHGHCLEPPFHDQSFSSSYATKGAMLAGVAHPPSGTGRKEPQLNENWESLSGWVNREKASSKYWHCKTCPPWVWKMEADLLVGLTSVLAKSLQAQASLLSSVVGYSEPHNFLLSTTEPWSKILGIEKPRLFGGSRTAGLFTLFTFIRRKLFRCTKMNPSWGRSHKAHLPFFKIRG